MQFYLINREMEEIFAFSSMVGKVAYINSVKKKLYLIHENKSVRKKPFRPLSRQRNPIEKCSHQNKTQAKIYDVLRLCNPDHSSTFLSTGYYSRNFHCQFLANNQLIRRILCSYFHSYFRRRINQRHQCLWMNYENPKLEASGNFVFNVKPNFFVKNFFRTRNLLNYILIKNKF